VYLPGIQGDLKVLAPAYLHFAKQGWSWVLAGMVKGESTLYGAE
jgi:hypothetical protein